MTAGPTVLLAEDYPEHQYVTRGLLEQCGCGVVEAASGEEAVSLALSHHPDMIILDLRMPALDGYEAARRIRNDPKLRNVPMVAYTADYSYVLAEGALEAGFDECIIKPVTLEDMRQLVRRHLPETEKRGGGK